MGTARTLGHRSSGGLSSGGTAKVFVWQAGRQGAQPGATEGSLSRVRGQSAGAFGPDRKDGYVQSMRPLLTIVGVEVGPRDGGNDGTALRPGIAQIAPAVARDADGRS